MSKSSQKPLKASLKTLSTSTNPLHTAPISAGRQIDLLVPASIVPDTPAAGYANALVNEDDYYCDLNDHPYAISTRLDEEESRKRDIERQNGREYKEIEFSCEVIQRCGVFEGAEMFHGNRGAIEEVTLSNQSSEYRLTIGTCGRFAPGWVKEAHHDRPMWIFHCPGLPLAHINGCCFFEGLANQSINSRNYTREEGTIGISFLVWNLGKFDEVIARINDEMLESLRNADNNEGSIVVAFVGKDSCTLVGAQIPAGLVSWISNYENIFEQTRNPVTETAKFLLGNAETSIEKELKSAQRVPELCRVVQWPVAAPAMTSEETAKVSFLR
jgi:hypothetical protein